jgi:hypothetical protein
MWLNADTFWHWLDRCVLQRVYLAILLWLYYRTWYKLAGNCRWQAGYFRVNTGRVHSLQIPVSHWFCTGNVWFYTANAWLESTQKLANFLVEASIDGASHEQISLLEFDKCFHRINSNFPIYGLQPRKLRQEISYLRSPYLSHLVNATTINFCVVKPLFKGASFLMSNGCVVSGLLYNL